jgi:hypothetical protein
MRDKYHSAGYFRERRKEQRDNKSNYNESDPFYHPRFVEAGRKISAMMRLPTLDWSPDLFIAKEGFLDERLCACGCGRPHNNAVSRVVEGRAGKRIFWYRTRSCRNKHKGRL